MVDMGCNSCQMMRGIVIWCLVLTVQHPLRFSMQAPFIVPFIWLQQCSQNATVRLGRRFQEALFCPMTPHKQSGLTVHDKSRSLSVVPNTLGSSIGQITAAAPLPKSRATHTVSVSTPAEAEAAAKSGWQQLNNNTDGERTLDVRIGKGEEASKISRARFEYLRRTGVISSQ